MARWEGAVGGDGGERRRQRMLLRPEGTAGAGKEAALFCTGPGGAKELPWFVEHPHEEDGHAAPPQLQHALCGGAAARRRRAAHSAHGSTSSRQQARKSVCECVHLEDRLAERSGWLERVSVKKALGLKCNPVL